MLNVVLYTHSQIWLHRVFMIDVVCCFVHQCTTWPTYIVSSSKGTDGSL